MTFTTKNWEDAPSEATPIDAAALEDIETRLSDYTDSEVSDEATARAAADTSLDARVDVLEASVTTIAEVPGLQAALDALQASATAATDTELASAVATINTALAGKQDASAAATDAELASAVATINTSLAAKQDASSAATDAELASAVATINAAVSVKADAAATATAIAAKANPLTATAVKTGAYTANADELVPVDVSAGSVPITLPTAPADKTRVAVKAIAVTSPNTVTIARGGTDVFNKAGGSTSLSLSLLNQAVVVQYAAATGVWYVVSTDAPLAALDARYQAAGGGGGSAAPRIIGAPATNLGTSQTIAFSGAEEVWLLGVLNGNLSITTSGDVAGARLVVLATQDATGNRTLTVDGQAITIAGAASGAVVVQVRWADATTFRVISSVPALDQSIVDAKGDLLIGTADNAIARFAATGVLGNVLTEDPTTASGWKSVAPAPGAGGTWISPFLTTQWYGAAMANGANNVSKGNAVATAVPFIPGRAGTVAAMRASVQVAASAGGVVRLGIYTHDVTTGKPGTLVVDAGTIDPTSTGVKAITGLSAALTANTPYWLVAAAQGAPTTNPQLKGFNGASGNPLCPIDPTNLSLGCGFTNSTGFSGAFPASTSGANWAVADVAYNLIIQAT